MSEGNFQAGQVSIDSVTLVNQEGEIIDLTNIAMSIDIFEGIDSPFLSGRISVLDALAVFRKYKIYGQEHLTIRYRARKGHGEFEDGDFAVEKTFRVYKVTDMINREFTSYAYVIHFCEPKLFTCQRTRLSKVLRGSYSEILLQTLLKDADFEKLPTSNRIDYWEETLPENQQIVCPNWTISKLIDYIKENANKGEDAVYKNSMFFYQTLIGGFKFMSLNQMLGGDMDFLTRFTYTPRNVDTAGEEVQVEAEDLGLNTKIMDFEIQKRGDTLHGTTSGAYASLLRTYDPILKIEREVVFDLGKKFKKTASSHMSGFPTVRLDDPIMVHQASERINGDEEQTFDEIGAEVAPNKSFDGKTLLRVNQTNAYSDSAVLRDTSQFVGGEYFDTGILERNSMIHALSSHVYKVTLPLRTDMSAGMVVTLDLPGGSSDKETDNLDDKRYLITKIHHIVSPLSGDGSMVLQCVKESFADEIKKQQALKDYKGPRGPNE